MKVAQTPPLTDASKSKRPAIHLEDASLFIYQNELLSAEAFKRYRLSEGVACKKCGHHEHYWLAAKEQFQCKKCKFRTTLRSGTLLENSKLPVSYLFIAAHLLLKTQNKLTPEQLQHTTGHKYYEPLWYLLRKIKEDMNPFKQSLLLLNFIEVVQNSLSGVNLVPYISLPKN